MCFALRFHFAVGCLCSLTGVLIRVSAAEDGEGVARVVEINVAAAKE